jgi:MFS family permease
MASAKMTVFVFCILSFTLSIDYSLSLISALAYWNDLGGNHNYGGLLFGVYDAFVIIITPILAKCVINKGQNYKKMFVFCLIVNLIGNVMYGIAGFIQSWIVLLVGRIVSGIGATCVPLIMVFIFENIDGDEKNSVIAYIKYTATLSRMIGPIIGSVLSASPDDNEETTIGRLFNMYTLVGWIPVLMCIITIPIVLCCFNDVKNPLIEDIDTSEMYDIEGIVNKEDAIPEHINKVSCLDVFKQMWSILVLGFISTFVYWMFMSNSLIIATHYYTTIRNHYELWHIYVSGFGGFIISFIVFMVAKKQMASLGGLMIGLILLYASLIIFVVKNNIAYYVGTGMITLSYGLSIPAINIINNQIAKQKNKSIGDNIALVITLLTIAQSIGRFVGPAMFSTFVTIDDSSIDCDLSNDDKYIIEGCKLNNFTMATIIIVCVSFIITLICAKHIHTILNHTSKSNETPLLQDKINNSA